MSKVFSSSYSDQSKMKPGQAWERRTHVSVQNLSKYYKHVLKCRSCRENYGSDKVTTNGWCPKCDAKFNNKKSVFDKINVSQEKES